MDLPRITPGTRLRLPDIRTELSARYPDNKDELQERAHAWARPYMERRYTAAEINRYLDQGIPSNGPMCYPDCLADRQQESANMFLITGLVDDQFSQPEAINNPGLAKKWIRGYHEALLDGIAPPPDKVPERMLYDAAQPILARARPGVRHRWAATHQQVIDSFVTEAALRSGDQTETYDEYLNRRPTTFYGTWSAVHLEFTCDIDLTEELTACQELAAARDHAFFSAALTNDAFSFWKEYCAGDFANALCFLMRDGLDPQEAIDQLFSLINGAEESYQRSCTKVREQYPDRPDIDAYLTGLGAYIAGNREFHLISPRYTVGTERWGPGDKGFLVLNPDATLTFELQ